MKVLVVLSFVAIANAGFEAVPQPPSANGFIQNIAIPLAEEILKKESKAVDTSPTRIIGGSLAQLGKFPYQAGLIASYQDLNSRGVCGGSLVSDNRVITAAHCWFDGRHQAHTVEVVLGSLTLFTEGTRLNSSNVIVHPKWNPTLIRNDVAMIYLPSQVTFSETISPIALPLGAELNEDFVGEKAIASGFGLTTNDGKIEKTQSLSYVQLNIIRNSMCWLAFPLFLQDSNMCISSIGYTSTCRGDSGGPLVVTRNNRTILVGITSFGSSFGCDISMPAAFSRVSSFIDFFNQNM